ncbi:hypothetical protein A3844_25005 [Paenibacillus helianthi]|uniref:RNase H type-1 domain-containing protein n=1 Tax=Paenibacillus helianthi TaxID=1349432 RepID=A0ABX3EJ63_9BACL|nr:hypothetical protein [Paenibacillus helianthi]OKP81847.1 hypothetical protein A3844_25005 [Paenibacillus helianthi]
MTDRLPDDRITYAHLAIVNLQDGRIAAGARLSKRSYRPDGGVLYEPYAVCSLYYDSVRNNSTRQAILVIAADILAEVDPATELLIIRANTPHFRRYRELEALINAYSLSRGVVVKVAHKPGIERSIPELMALANDAIERKESVTCRLY